MHGFKVSYEDKTAYYSSKKKEQDFFVEGKEVEFVEEVRQGKNGNYLVVKPVKNNPMSNFGKQMKKEQSRYSGFAMAYAKDLVTGGRLPIDMMYDEATRMFRFMVELDKTIEI